MRDSIAPYLVGPGLCCVGVGSLPYGCGVAVSFGPVRARLCELRTPNAGIGKLAFLPQVLESTAYGVETLLIHQPVFM